jgi:hypothetical protein
VRPFEHPKVLGYEKIPMNRAFIVSGLFFLLLAVGITLFPPVLWRTKQGKPQHNYDFLFYSEGRDVPVTIVVDPEPPKQGPHRQALLQAGIIPPPPDNSPIDHLSDEQIEELAASGPRYETTYTFGSRTIRWHVLVMEYLLAFLIASVVFFALSIPRHGPAVINA